MNLRLNESNTAAIGHLQGKPISNLPKGLFIPEEALEIELNQFEGPLDLLLFMIRKQDLDIKTNYTAYYRAIPCIYFEDETT